MEMSDVVSEIKLSLTGDVLELEIEDATIEALVNRTLREIERYFDGYIKYLQSNLSSYLSSTLLKYVARFAS